MSESAEKFRCEICLEQDRYVLEDAVMVILPGSEGELGVMQGHMPLIVELTQGNIIVHRDAGNKEFKITKGVAQINQESVKIIGNPA